VPLAFRPALGDTSKQYLSLRLFGGFALRCGIPLLSFLIPDLHPLQALATSTCSFAFSPQVLAAENSYLERSQGFFPRLPPPEECPPFLDLYLNWKCLLTIAANPFRCLRYLFFLLCFFFLFALGPLPFLPLFILFCRLPSQGECILLNFSRLSSFSEPSSSHRLSSFFELPRRSPLSTADLFPGAR